MSEIKSSFFVFERLRKKVEEEKNKIEDDPSRINGVANYLIWEIADVIKKLKKRHLKDIDLNAKQEKLEELSRWLKETKNIEEQKMLFYDLVDLYEDIKGYYLENTKVKEVTAELKYEEALEKAEEESKYLLEEYKKMSLKQLGFLENWWNNKLKELENNWEINAPLEVFEVYQKLQEKGAFKYAEKFRNFYIKEIKKRIKQIKKIRQNKMLKEQKKEKKKTEELKSIIEKDIVEKEQTSEEIKHGENTQKKEQENIKKDSARERVVAPKEAVPKEIEEEFRLHEEWLPADRRKPRFKVIFYDNKRKKLGVVFYGRRGKKRKEEKTIDEMRQIIASGGYKVFNSREVKPKFTQKEEPRKETEKTEEELLDNKLIKDFEEKFKRIRNNYQDNPQEKRKQLENLLKTIKKEEELLTEDEMRAKQRLVILKKDIIAAINKIRDEILEKNKESESAKEKDDSIELEEEKNKEDASQKEAIKEKTIEEYLEELGFKVNIEDLELAIKYKVDESGEIKIDEKGKKDILDILKNLRGTENLTEEERELIIQNTATVLDEAVNRETEREFSKLWKHHKRVLLAGGLISLVAGIAGTGVRMLGGGMITKAAGSLAGGILGASAGFVRAWARERFNPILERIKKDNLKKFIEIKEEKAEELLTQENIKIVLLQELRSSLINKIIDTSRLSRETKIEEYKRLVREFISHNKELKSLEKDKQEKLVNSLSALALITNENSQMFSDLLEDKKREIKIGIKTKATLRGGALGLAVGVANSFTNIPNAGYIFSGLLSSLAIGGSLDAWMKRKIKEGAIEDVVMDVERILNQEAIGQKEIIKLHTLLKSGVLNKYPIIRERTREFLLKNALEDLTDNKIDEEFAEEIKHKLEGKKLKHLRKISAYTLGFSVGLTGGMIGKTIVEKAGEMLSSGLVQNSSDIDIKDNKLVYSLLVGVPEEVKETILQDESSLAYLQKIDKFIIELSMQADANSQSARREIENLLKEAVADGKISDDEYQKISEIYQRIFPPVATEPSKVPEPPKAEISPEEAERPVEPGAKEKVEDIGKEIVIKKEEKLAEPIEVKIGGKVDTFSEAIYEAAKEAYSKGDYERVDNFIHNVLGDEVKINDQDRFKFLQKAVRVLSIRNIGKIGDESVKNLVYEGNIVKLNADGTWSVEKAGGNYGPQAVTEEQLRENAHNIQEKSEKVKILSLKEINSQLKESLGVNDKEEDENVVIIQFGDLIQIKINDDTIDIDLNKGNWKIDEYNLEGKLDEIPEDNRIKYFKELIEKAKHPFEDEDYWGEEIKLDDKYIVRQLNTQAPIKFFDIKENDNFDKIPDIAQIGDTYIYREDNETWNQFEKRVINEYVTISHEREQLLNNFGLTSQEIEQYGIENIVTENNLEEKLEFIKLHKESWSPEKIKTFFIVSEELNKDYNDPSFSKIFEKLDPSFYKNPNLAKALIELNEEKYSQGIKDLLKPALLTYNNQRGFEYKDGLLKIKGVHDGRGSEYTILLDLKNNKIGLDGPAKWNFGTKGWFKARPALELTADNVKAVLNKVHEFSAQELGIEK